MTAGPVLVTGFEPYGGCGSNPAFEVMQELNGRNIAGAIILGRSLPVSFASLKTSIDTILDETRPSAVISLGLWPGEPIVRIERIGINIADFEIADNEKVLLRDAQISSNGMVARAASLPARNIEEALLAEGIPARLSGSAGTFLCNACLYSFLEALAILQRPVPCGFIHLPYTPEQVAEMIRDLRAGQIFELHQRADLASMELSRSIRAVEIVIETTMRMLNSRD